MKQYLPQSVFSQIELVFRKPNPTIEQLNRITKLGESIGLQSSEIIAAIDAPLKNQEFSGGRRTSILIPLILASIAIVVGILLAWAIVDPRSFPISTYTPGTDYGTIRPQDFSSQNHSPFAR